MIFDARKVFLKRNLNGSCPPWCLRTRRRWRRLITDVWYFRCIVAAYPEVDRCNGAEIVVVSLANLVVGDPAVR